MHTTTATPTSLYETPLDAIDINNSDSLKLIPKRE